MGPYLQACVSWDRVKGGSDKVLDSAVFQETIHLVLGYAKGMPVEQAGMSS